MSAHARGDKVVVNTPNNPTHGLAVTVDAVVQADPVLYYVRVPGGLGNARSYRLGPFDETELTAAKSPESKT